MDDLTGFLLGARNVPATRGDLRRGDNPASEHYAYRHLAHFWADAPYLKEPVLLFGALVATSERVPHAQSVTLGQALYGLDQRATERRIVAVQGGDIRLMHTSLRSILRKVERIDWWDVWSFYQWWDQPNLGHRRATRRRLLEQFYQQRHRSEHDEKTSSTSNATTTPAGE